MLSSELAQQIASDITEVIGHNVLITDANSIVLGSGDRSRVGQFHEASVGVVRTKSTRRHTHSDVAALEGSLPGVTLPLTVDHEVVGTVGLSGPPGLVGQFGLIVKRQTEILLAEANRIGIRASRQRAAEDLLRDVFDLHHSDVEHETVTRRANALGYDPDIPQRIIVLRVREHPWIRQQTYTESDLANGIIEVVREYFNDAGDLSARLSRSIVAVMTSARTPAEQLHNRCAAIVERGTARGWSVTLAIGPCASGAAQLNTSAQDARDALELGERFDPDTRIHDIDRLRLLQVMHAVPETSRDRFTRGVLGEALGLSDWPELRKTLLAWGESGFNAKRAAENMHVHRNTLLYRLNKIERYTGHAAGPDGNPVVLYLAAILSQVPVD